MKYRKKVLQHIEVSETYVETRIVCDFCNRELNQVSQQADRYDYSRIKLDAKIGSNYPEGDYRKGYVIDCCVDCFFSKVKPAIEALGVEWHEYDVEDMYVGQKYSDYYIDETHSTHIK